MVEIQYAVGEIYGKRVADMTGANRYSLWIPSLKINEDRLIPSKLEEILNRLGKDGWDVSLAAGEANQLLILKRVLPQK